VIAQSKKDLTLQFEAKLTLDGLMTLVGGIIAFAAVIIQIRSSSKQLDDQMKAQQESEREERERQKRAIARAIICEIDSFYRFDLEPAEKSLSSRDVGVNSFPTAMWKRGNASEIYKANSQILGSLNSKSVFAIVTFYGMVGSYEGLFRDYQRCLDVIAFASNPPQNIVEDTRERLDAIRGLIPELKEMAASVTRLVTQDCGLDDLIAKNDAQTH